MKDDTLYKALYCGVCKSIGGTCGQMARMTLTYDIAFLSAITHNMLGTDVVIKKSHCIIHPITRRPIAGRTKISDMLADVNVILAYHKLLDDVYDSGRGKLKSAFFKGAYKKARKRYPQVDKIVGSNYKTLFDLEKAGCDSIDMACDPFSNMLAELSDFVLDDKKTEYTTKLFYYLGKWIYLIDALDDYDKDVRKNEYNVLKLTYKSINAKKLIEEHGGDVAFTFNVIFSEIADCYNNVKFYFNSDLIGNILLRGLAASTDNIVKRINENA